MQAGVSHQFPTSTTSEGLSKGMQESSSPLWWIRRFFSCYTKEELLILIVLGFVISLMLILVFGPGFLLSLLCGGWA